MNQANATAADKPVAGFRVALNRGADRLTTLISHGTLALASRLAVGSIFFLSGRSKVDGILTVSDGAHALFREEYKVPLLPPELAAHMAAYASISFQSCWCWVSSLDSRRWHYSA